MPDALDCDVDGDDAQVGIDGVTGGGSSGGAIAFPAPAAGAPSADTNGEGADVAGADVAGAGREARRGLRAFRMRAGTSSNGRRPAASNASMPSG